MATFAAIAASFIISTATGSRLWLRAFATFAAQNRGFYWNEFFFHEVPPEREREADYQFLNIYLQALSH